MTNKILKFLALVVVFSLIGSILVLFRIKSITSYVKLHSENRDKPESYIFAQLLLLFISMIVLTAVNVFIWVTFITAIV